MIRSLALRSLPFVCICLACGALSPLLFGKSDLPAASSEKKTSATQEGSGDAEALQKVLERVSRLEREINELRAKEGKVPLEKQDQRIIAVCETPYLGSIYAGPPGNVRFFTTRLMLINLTNEPLTLTQEDIQLSAGGQMVTLKDVPQRFQNHSIQLAQQTLPLRNLQMPKQIQVGAGATASQWILFSDFPTGNDVPQLVVKIKLAEKSREIDVTTAQRSALGVKVERIGPYGCLGLVTLNGQLDTINVGALVEELDRLSNDKVARAVIRWGENAPPIFDRQLISWLQNSVAPTGRSQGGELLFPPVPVTIRELHLAAIPFPPNSGYGVQSTANGMTRIHKTDADAVRAALSSAYEALPRDEVLQAIQTGSRLERAAALENGAGRLAADKLPLILKFADDNDPVIQQGALAALGHFGDQAAIDKLLFYARQNVEPVSTAAITGLASSRYAAAHAALLDVLNSEAPAAKKNIVKVLARYPRPIWSDAIYEFVKDPREELNREALAALVQVGHPQLVPLLEETLNSRDETLKQQAFGFLLNRTDRESEEIAVNYTLQQLKSAPPSPAMLMFLNRVKDRRAAPLLMARFNNSQNKTGIIQTLSILGDEETAKFLFEKYPTVQNQEKGEILRALQRLNSPMFRTLAAQALLVPDNPSLVGYAVQGLQEDGGPEAIKLIIEALEKSSDQNTWSYLCNALATMGTPAARAALVKARDSGNDQKRAYAGGALQQLRERSPGYAYIYQGQAFQRQEKWKEAIEQYEMAIQLDPQLPDAYASRADALVRQNKYAEAGKDYAKAYELDPFNSNAVTGVCIVMVVVDGKIDEAVKKIEDVRSKFANEAGGAFVYNAACVYGRAVELLKKNEKLADRDKLIPQYTQAALADLKKSVELGFQDFDWMKKDPDLKSLHDAPEFEKVATPPNPADGNGQAPRRALNPRFR